MTTRMILSIDGGGIRGIIPAILLAEIERLTDAPISESFDLIAGTSTGGIIALALTMTDNQGAPRYNASDLIDLYELEGPKIFSKSSMRTIFSAKGLTDEKYSSKGIDEVLEKYFKQARLKDTVDDTDVLITSYEIEHRRPWFFKSYNAKRHPESHDYFMKDVARATSAAPTYFDPAKIDISDKDYYAMIDGGVFANNPAMCAYVEAMNKFPGDEILLVSLGTGELTRRLPYEDAKDWGKLGWALPILSVTFDGVSDSVDYHLASILKHDYYRFQVILNPENDDLDNVEQDNIRDLKITASNLIIKERNKFSNLAKLLKT